MAVAGAGVGAPLVLSLLGILFFGASPAAGGVERVMIDPEVPGVVHAGGARVLVEVRLPGMRPEGELTPEAARAQRHAIAAAERAVLSRLSGRRFSLLREYETVPLLLLEVHDDALTALERMGDVVARVRLDIPRPPVAPGAAR